MGCSISTLCPSLSLKELEIVVPKIPDSNTILEQQNSVKGNAFDSCEKNKNSGEINQTCEKTKAGTPERAGSVDESVSFDGVVSSHRSTLNSPCMDFSRNLSNFCGQNEGTKLKHTQIGQHKNHLEEMTSFDFRRFFTFRKQVTNSQKKFFDKHLLIEQIGKGGGGEVYKVIHQPSNEFRVAKIIGYTKDKTEARIKKLNKRLLLEANLVASLDHPNIVKVHEILQDEMKAAFIMQYVKGEDLYKNLNNPLLQNNQSVANIMEQIFSALSYLHNKGIIHKDIKLQNVVLEEQHQLPSIKLIDFGFSDFIDKLSTHKLTGTIGYMSPEALQNEHDLKSDLWSAGVLLYIFLFKKLPFKGKTHEEISLNIFNQDLDSLLLEKQDICADPLVLQLLKKLLKRDINERYSAFEALNDPFIRKYAPKHKVESSDIELLRTYQQKTLMELMMSSIYVHHMMPDSERLKLTRVFKTLDKAYKGFITYEDLNAIDSSIVIEREKLINNLQGAELTNFTITCVDLNNSQTIRSLFVYFDKTNCFRVKMSDILSSLENHIHKYAFEEIQKLLRSQKEHELSYEEFKKMIKSF